jgi:hypothetical protein
LAAPGPLGCLWQNWRLRRQWRLGVSADQLAKRYYNNDNINYSNSINSNHYNDNKESLGQ